jgi:hypothetical protein
MTLKEMWKEYLELYEEYLESYEEGGKLREEGDKLWDKSKKLLNDFVKKNYGKETEIKYYINEVTLSNGIILYHDGRVYEPLEVVMREIIRKNEER